MAHQPNTPDRISVEQLLAWKNSKVKPIDGINIPNITVPIHLVSKKRPTEASDKVDIKIRQLFNSVTSENIPEIREQLRLIVHTKAHTVEILKEISAEIFKNFIVNEKNIKNYMHLLNAIWNASVLTSDDSSIEKKAVDDKSIEKKAVSPPIGNYFLTNCKDMIFEFVSRENIKRLAEMDLEDNDQLDLYNRERDKIINLIVTICCLYEQRKTVMIKLNANHLYSVIKHIMDIYTKLQARMKELGNPYEDVCDDEDEYELLRKMSSLYAEQLYTFMAREGKEFIMDKTVIKDKISQTDQCMEVLVDRFKKEVIPTLTEAFLVSKCASLEF